MKKLFLLDAYALIYRAYYAMMRTPRFTSKGLNTSAIFGFVNTLEDLLRKEAPTHLAVCFDPSGGKTFRHEMFDAYKAGRAKQPEDITLSIPYIKRILRAMNIPVVEVPGYEADDVIGTLAHRASQTDFTTYMMTLDKDYGQLVRPNVLMYRPALKGQGFEVRGPQEVCDLYGLKSTAQVIDLLALEGDKSDNVPGCPGVGEKTAVGLLLQYGSVDEILANVQNIKGKLAEKIADNRDQILLSRDLVTIRTDINIDLQPDDFVRREADAAALREVYEELEFRSFLLKLPATKEPADTAITPAPAEAVEGLGGLFDLLPEAETQPLYAPKPAGVMEEALSAPFVGLTVYAVGAEPMTAEILGAAIAVAPERALYLPTARLGELQPLLSRPDVTVVSTDCKRDMLLLRRVAIDWKAEFFDVTLGYYLVQPEGRKLPADLAFTLLDGYRMIDFERAPKVKKCAAIDADEAEVVVSQRADIALRLRQPVIEAQKQAEVPAELRRLEHDLLPVLTEMEWTGVRIDPTILQELSASLTARCEALEEEIYALAGHPFNTASPAQVGEVLFGEMQLDTKVKRTKTGSFSTTEEVLEKYRAKWPIVDLILQVRGLKKLLATYINALPELVVPTTGRIHSTFNQTGTVTGRLSSSNPNLQNIPVRTDLGREIRRAFVADPGCLLLAADYSQIELRLMADISGDPAMIEAFGQGEDIHRATAAKIYHRSLDEVTDTERRNAKTANFGIIYGISAFGLSERLGISRAEAKMLIDGYFNTYPGVKQYMDNTVLQAREKEYVCTVMNRRRMLPDINSRNAVVRGYAERNAINAPLQGSAADIIKVAMVHIQHEIEQRGLRSKMLMQVHDELVFNVPMDEVELMQELVERQMSQAYRGRVALTVSTGLASNWLDAH